MNELRMNPETMTFSLLAPQQDKCVACNVKTTDLIKTVPFRKSEVKIYEIKTRVQPSKYELKGKGLKASIAHGYEELIVDQTAHGDSFTKYTPEEIEELLNIIKDRKIELSKYEFGTNFVAARYLQGHGAFDLVISPVPSTSYKQCVQCMNIENVDGREIRRTENFVAYTSFAPTENLEINISPIKHMQLDTMDSVLAFDLAGMISAILSKIENKDLTLAIIENKSAHFNVKIVKGNKDPFELTGIKLVNIAPESLAERLRDEQKV